MSDNHLNPRDITIDAYDYPLADERIARHPLPQRDACKLLVLQPDSSIVDARFSEIGQFLPTDCTLVVNDTRVINARLQFRKPTGAQIEIFCLEPVEPADYAQCFATTRSCLWTCLVGNSKRWQSGPVEARTVIDGVEVAVSAHRVGRSDTDASSTIRFEWTAADGSEVPFAQVISALGEIPIPPYLNRESQQADAVDYQTIYSHIDGSVAAPTAGLHFTPELMESLVASGVQRVNVTLHVGAGTFRPVKSETIGEHPMHAETIVVAPGQLKALRRSLADGRQIVAVGTTSVRTLESLYHAGCLLSRKRFEGSVPQWYPYSADHPHLSPLEALDAVIAHAGDEAFQMATSLIIAPGYSFNIVDAIITNFHQPRSTLLLLVSALIGDRWRSVYDHALANPDYRFLSYGDACLLYPQR